MDPIKATQQAEEILKEFKNGGDLSLLTERAGAVLPSIKTLRDVHYSQANLCTSLINELAFIEHQRNLKIINERAISL